MSRVVGLALFTGALLIAGCALFGRREAIAPTPNAAVSADVDAGAEGAAAPSLEEEEASLEGVGEDEAPGDPIAAFIAGLGEGEPGARAPAEEGGQGPEPAAIGGTATSAAQLPRDGLTAFDLWSMTDEACLALLAGDGIAVSRPDFATPFVRQPLLLDGPIDGVTIRPKWRRSVRVNEVMDCRLVAALRDAAAAARSSGFKELMFYSTYRPLKEGARAGTASMHRRGLAIDVGWLTAESGEAVSVLDDYERHSGAPPCEAGAETDLGRRLRDFACALHAAKAFNVVLTPNANKAHHNHFHLDVTPNARWYIVR
jgi:hypothetical protein